MAKIKATGVTSSEIHGLQAGKPAKIIIPPAAGKGNMFHVKHFVFPALKPRICFGLVI